MAVHRVPLLQGEEGPRDQARGGPPLQPADQLLLLRVDLHAPGRLQATPQEEASGQGSECTDLCSLTISSFILKPI